MSSKLTPEIIYEDNDILVLNKPAGMIVNNADTSKDVETLQDFIEESFQFSVHSSQANIESEFVKRAGIVHRLDKETSGVLVVAKNEESFKNLQAQFKQKDVKKVYTALCHGHLVEEGEINVPIGRLPWNRMRFGVIPNGRESYTKFKTIAYKKIIIGKKVEELSLVEVYPMTGRTHQIRVHFQYVGHPIFADALYAGRKTIAVDRRYLARHFLHASILSLLHPHTHERMEFVAPLSSELVDFLTKLS